LIDEFENVLKPVEFSNEICGSKYIVSSNDFIL